MSASENKSEKEFSVNLKQHINAGYQCLGVNTIEGPRVERVIKEVANDLGMNFAVWDIHRGLIIERFGDDRAQSPVQDSTNPMVLLDKLLSDEHDGKGMLVVLRDLDERLTGEGTAVIRRRLRNALDRGEFTNPKRPRHLILTAKRLALHDRFEHYVSMLNFSLPADSELRDVITFLNLNIGDAKAQCNPQSKLADSLVAAMRGLTRVEAENALFRAVVVHEGYKDEMVGTIKDEKATIVKRGEVLTYIPDHKLTRADDLAGFEEYVSFLERRKSAYTPEARSINLDFPKGVVLLGIPGTAKSVAATLAARVFGQSMFEMNVGALFGSLVGESEGRLRDALKQIDVQQGCVVLIDEADKAFEGMAKGGGDSGVGQRVFGTLLSWLSNNESKAFVVMTMNRSQNLPPELLRAGRFDTMFYTDLPNPSVRRKIFEIHARKRQANLSYLKENEWTAVLDRTDQFVGSEVEAAYKEARYIAYERRKSGDPNVEELLEGCSSVTPLAKVDPTNMTAMREFVKNRARPVTATQALAATGSSSGRTRRVSVSNNPSDS